MPFREIYIYIYIYTHTHRHTHTDIYLREGKNRRVPGHKLLLYALDEFEIKVHVRADQHRSTIHQILKKLICYKHVPVFYSWSKKI